MSDRDQIRQLIDLVENTTPPDFAVHKRLVSKLRRLIKKTNTSWFTLVIQAWREFSGDPPKEPNEEQIPIIRRSLETRLARQLRTLEDALEEMNVILNEIEESTPPVLLSYRFVEMMRDMSNDMRDAMEILQDEGYYPPNDPSPWSYRDEMKGIYKYLDDMSYQCYKYLLMFV